MSIVIKGNIQLLIFLLRKIYFSLQKIYYVIANNQYPLKSTVIIYKIYNITLDGTN